MNKLISLIFAVMLISASIFAGGKQEAEQTVQQTQEPIHLKLRTMTHGDEVKVENALIEEFNKTHPDIQVEVAQGEWTEAYTQVRLSVMAEDPPHIFLSHILKVVEMYEYYTPLDDSPVGNLIAMSGLDDSKLHQGAYNLGNYKGNQYIIPLDNHGFVIWYNKDIFKEVGLDPDPESFPDSREAFEDACEAIKNAGYYAFHPAADGPPRYLRRAWFTFYWQQGSELFDKNYTKATFNNDKGLKALQYLVDIYNDKGWNAVGSDGYKQFAAGELGILHAGNWYYANARNSGINWGAWKVPNLFGTRQAWGNSEGFVILKQPKGTSKEIYLAAMEFIKWYLEHSHKWTIGSGMITAWEPAQQKEELLNSDFWKDVGQYLAETMSEGALHFPIIHPRGAELESAITTNVELAVNGEITAKEALNRAEEECNKILQQ